MRKPEMNKSKSIWMFSALCAAVLPYTTLVAGPSDSKSGSGPAGSADAEVIKRLQRIENARKAEADGDRLMADGDYEGAIGKYQEALSGIPNAPMAAADRSRIIAKFSQACIKQADKLGKMGRFDEAKTLLKRVLAEDVDQDNSSAKTLLKRLDDPDYYNPSMTDKHYKNTEEVSRLLKEGLGYFDLGQFNEAEDSFNKILAIDPHNVAARRQLEKTEHEIDNYLVSARDHTRAHMLRMVDEIWETAVPHAVPVNKDKDSGGGGDTKGTAILLKLRNTNLQRLSFEQASIDEVISYLRAKSVELDNIDPNKAGVNFILQTKGKQTAPITLDLRDVPMIVALDQICALAGLSYRIDAHAVVITSIDGSSNRLETRVFRVPPNFLSTAGGGGGGAAPAAAADPFAAPAAGGAAAGSSLSAPPTAKTVLNALGANFEAPGSEATFLPGSSRLIVKNTLQQLDFIEKIIDDLGKQVAKQVNITTKFVEISQRNGEELGFDTLIGAFNIGSRTFGSGGTAGNQGPVNAVDYPFLDPNGSASATPTITGQNVVSNGLRGGSRAIATNAVDGLLANGIASQGAKLAAPGVLALAGVFTDPQFQIVLRALSQKKGVDLMTAPSIVTKSGQRAKIEIIREFPYPTDFDPPQIPQTFGATSLNGGGLGTGGGTTAVSASSFPVTPTTPTTFTVRNTGVTMEVDPVIGEDGYTIDLTLAPEVVEFEGFINYGSPINSSAINALGVPTTLTLTENRIEQPVFATRKLNTSVTIWDGQTVGIGGLMREDVQMVEDKVPLLGDIPFLGRLFKTKSEEHFKKNLMVYVSAVLIDPSGGRINNRRESAPEATETVESPGPATDLIPAP
jgi:general secretion pathway protein D